MARKQANPQTWQPVTLFRWRVPWLLPDGSVYIRYRDDWMRVDADDERALSYQRMLTGAGEMIRNIEKRDCLIARGIPQEWHGAWMRANGAGWYDVDSDSSDNAKARAA